MNYFKKLFITLFLVYTSFVLITFIVDPYDKLRLNLLNLKIKGVFDKRTDKFYHLDNKQNKYEAFILGSSRAMQLQPSIVEDKTGFKTFNYAVYSATPEDYLAMTKHIIKRQKAKLILLHLDFYAFNKSMPISKKFYNSPLINYFQNLKQDPNISSFLPKEYFSITALISSIKVLEKNFKNRNKKDFKIDKKNIQVQDKNTYKFLKEYWDKEYLDFAISNKRINYLKQIKQLCDKNNIKLYISLSPVAKNHYEKIMSDEKLKQNTKIVKKTICNIFGNYVDFFNSDTNNFSQPKYWMDSVHPSTLMGKLLSYNIFDTNITKNLGKYYSCD